MNERKRVHIALCRMIPTHMSDELALKKKETVERIAAEVQAFYREVQWDKWDVHIEAFIIRYDGYVDPPMYARNTVDEHLKDYDGDLQFNYFAVWGKMKNNYCGQGTLGGNRCCIKADIGYASTCSVGTVGHELGHNFDLGHSGTLKNGSETEYNDFTLMGGGGNMLKRFNSPHLLYLDTENLKEIYDVTETQQILMCPIELPYHAQHAGEYQHFIIRKEGHEPVFIAMFKSKPWVKYAQPDYKEGRIYAYYLSDKRTTKRIDTPLVEPGARLLLPNGASLYYEEYRNETARVTVRMYPDDPLPPDIPMPEGFPEVLPSNKLLPSYTGAWYNPKYSGQGVDLHIVEHMDDGVLKKTLALFFYTADNTGKTMYMMAHENKFTGNEVTMLLEKTEGGSWDNPTTYETVPMGVCKVEFFNEERGVFHWNTEGYGRGAVEILPAAPVNNNIFNGVFYDPNRDGEGLTVQILKDNKAAVFFYFFDQYGNQNWVSCEGVFDESDNAYYLTVYKVHNLEFMYPSNVIFVNSGSARLEYLTTHSVKFDFAINIPGLNASGTINATRLL